MLFGISFETWKSVCNMYFSLRTSTKEHCLQWFPLAKLSYSDEELLTSRKFFDELIKTGAFLLYPNAIHQSENFLQKSDGSFRNATLIAPILYLVLQSIGKEIHDRYKMVRTNDISAYYAGNYACKRPHYKQDYDAFFKELNSSVDEYQYFIKTDITNFFANINLDKLISQIDKVHVDGKAVFSQTHLHLYKELLSYCGNGRFPLVENSVASSFLATIVYLDVVDTKLYEFIIDKISVFKAFRLIRYVDDMYILISSDKPVGYLHEAYNEIRNEYSSLLKEYGLSLNAKKCCIKETKQLNLELRKSLYDEYYNGQRHSIEELFHGALQHFLSDLSLELLLDSVDIEKYNELINRHFSADDIEFSPTEVFNYFIYENNDELCSEEVIKEISELVQHSISFIALDPRRLTIMIMKTQDEKAIKGLLNQLFIRNRENKWNSYDTTVAISYLIQSKFQHIDLLKILASRHPKLYEFYLINCKCSMVDLFSNQRTTELSKALALDNKALYLYFMYVCEQKRENHMAAFAYYKNFFDRITADLEFAFERDPQNKKPNYKHFYKEGSFVNFYKEITDSENIIKKAHKLRNANPLCHSSSELIDSDDTSNNLKNTIENLSKLIAEYLDKHKKEDNCSMNS